MTDSVAQLYEKWRCNMWTVQEFGLACYLADGKYKKGFEVGRESCSKEKQFHCHVTKEERDSKRYLDGFQAGREFEREDRRKLLSDSIDEGQKYVKQIEKELKERELRK
jgi:hypothetical protein